MVASISCPQTNTCICICLHVYTCAPICAYVCETIICMHVCIWHMYEYVWICVHVWIFTQMQHIGTTVKGIQVNSLMFQHGMIARQRCCTMFMTFGKGMSLVRVLWNSWSSYSSMILPWDMDETRCIPSEPNSILHIRQGVPCCKMWGTHWTRVKINGLHRHAYVNTYNVNELSY